MGNKLSFEKIRKIGTESKDSLIKKLEDSKFEVCGFTIYVKEPKSGHPMVGRHYLPVGGFIKERDKLLNEFYTLEIVNLDEKFPEDYHSKLKEIYNSI